MNTAEACRAVSSLPEVLIEGIDRAIEAHVAWSQRLLRCALLREPPGDDVLLPDAHSRCRFGVWFAGQRTQIDGIDAALGQGIAAAHEGMHDAVRRLCQKVLRGQAAADADLHAYEHGQSAMLALLNRLRERAAEAATRTDLLTGLPSRHALGCTFGLRRSDAQRARAQLWLALIDVDPPESVNGGHGRAVGDQALAHVAHRLQACMRDTDALFRFGGAEFLALFLSHDVRGAEWLAARLLDAVTAAPLATASGPTLRLSVTIGLARVRADEDLAGATGRADAALRLGKLNGRDRFVLAPD